MTVFLVIYIERDSRICSDCLIIELFRLCPAYIKQGIVPVDKKGAVLMARQNSPRKSILIIYPQGGEDGKGYFVKAIDAAETEET